MHRRRNDRWGRRDDRQLRLILGGIPAEDPVAHEPSELERSRAMHPSAMANSVRMRDQRDFGRDWLAEWWDNWSGWDSWS